MPENASAPAAGHSRRRRRPPAPARRAPPAAARPAAGPGPPAAAAARGWAPRPRACPPRPCPVRPACHELPRASRGGAGRGRADGAHLVVTLLIGLLLVAGHQRHRLLVRQHPAAAPAAGGGRRRLRAWRGRSPRRSLCALMPHRLPPPPGGGRRPRGPCHYYCTGGGHCHPGPARPQHCNAWAERGRLPAPHTATACHCLGVRRSFCLAPGGEDSLINCSPSRGVW